MIQQTIIIGAVRSEIIEYLKNKGYSVNVLSDNHINDNLRNHTDLTVLKIDSNTYIVAKNQTNANEYIQNKSNRIYQVEIADGAAYPYDCVLNFIILNNQVIGNKKCLKSLTNEIFAQSNLLFINVNQGYSKCSTIVIDKRYMITDDISIKKCADDNGIECLLVNKNNIVLEGYNYGFIGGASFVDDINKEVVFFGDITKHSDYKAIKRFIESIGYKLDYISDIPLTDIGGAVIIK